MSCNTVANKCGSTDCGSDAISIQNCTIYNSRCACVQCELGLYSSDCSKPCPTPAVAVLTDMLLLVGGVWFFTSSVYYYYYSHNVLLTAANEVSENAEEVSGRTSDVASSQQMQKATILKLLYF